MATRRMRRFDLIVAMSMLAIVLSVVGWQLWFPGRAFDSVVWKNEAQIDNGIRLAMADRLVARNMLQDKTRQEVVELLGEPLATSHFREWDLVYWLGPERGFLSVDSEWLVLRLTDGRVQECRIARD
jgi:hypothetical protein